MQPALIFIFIFSITIGFIVTILLSGISHESNGRSTVLQKIPSESATVDKIKKIRILCLLTTSPQHHADRSIHIFNTWRKKCDKLIFSSTLTDNNIDALGFNVTNDHSNQWGKTKLMLQYSYRNFINDYDWFYKGDDDTFAVIENMRFFLAAYSPENPIFFGHKFNTSDHKNGYFSGGSGYVMSNKAVRLFAEQILTNKSMCKVDRDNTAEDWEAAKCFEKVGVLAGDGRDLIKRERFLPFIPEHHLFNKPGKWWYWERKYYQTDEGLDCCSNYAIAYHYIGPKYMYRMYYLIYHLMTYGNIHRFPPPPKKLNFSHVAYILEQQRVNSTYFN